MAPDFRYQDMGQGQVQSVGMEQVWVITQDRRKKSMG